jgi:hypothetical protein
VRRRALYLISAFHLAAFAVGVVNPLTSEPVISTLRNVYHGFTGAGGSFGFFSPDIGNQVVIEFQTDSGKTLRLHELVTGEVALRIGNMYRLFIDTYRDEKLKRSVAASLAAQIFRHEALAKQVTMIASVRRFPSLEEFARGVRPETKEIYRITFAQESGANE